MLFQNTKLRMRLGVGLALLLWLSFPPNPDAAWPKTPPASAENQWTPLVNRLAAEGLERTELEALFSRAEVRYDPEPMRHKMRSLYDGMFGCQVVLGVQRNLKSLGSRVGPLDGRYGPRTRRAVIAFQQKMSLPLDGLPGAGFRRALEREIMAQEKSPAPAERRGKKVYTSALSRSQLARTRRYLAAHRPLLSQVRQKYGVPEEIAVGILTVETKVGTYLGRKKALTTLASMALCSDFRRVAGFFKKSELSPLSERWLKKKSGEKARWAYEELKALLRYARTNRADPMAFVGSIYGAIGISQFMPTNALKFGQDGDGDGRVDLFRHEDAVHSLGAYLKGHGWQKNMTREKKRQVLHAYNHSQVYVNTVLAVADYLSRVDKGKKSAGAVNLTRQKGFFGESDGGKELP